MQAVLLAAGNSTRFEPLTGFPHKSMVKIMGKTLLEHTLLHIKKAGITDVVLVVGENSGIPSQIPLNTLQMQIQVVEHIGAKGMGAALLDAKKYLKDEFFLLSPYHVDFDQFALEMKQKKTNEKQIVLLGKKAKDATQFGLMEINGDQVTAVVEKPQKILDNQLQIVAIYLLNTNFLETLATIPQEHYHFEKALDYYAQQKKVTFVKTNKETVSLKYAFDLLPIKNYLFKNIVSSVSPSAAIANTAVISGDVVIEEGAQVLEGAIVKGPCFIGKNAIIGNDVIIRNSTDIEEDVVVGARMEVKNSLLMDGVTTHSGFIGDSIVGSRSKIAAYICTANVRLDREPVSVVVKGEKVSSGLKHLGMLVGEQTNIGTRVTVMPGIQIGSNTIIGPSTTVMKNVKPSTKYYTRFQEVVEG